jgi:hypothetical protein
MKAYKETRSITPLILDLDSRWSGGGSGQLHVQAALPPETIPGNASARKMLDSRPESVWTVLEERTSLARTPDHPAHAYYAISAPKMSTSQERYHFTGVSFTSCNDTCNFVNRIL